MTSEVIEDEKQFYSKAKTYWKQIPPTVDGMLGGYGHISSIDINSSRKFLQRFLREGPNKTGTSCALDCGAGIGRITKRLLLPLFREVDMVDITEDFLVQAKTYLGEEGKRVRNYFCCGLQDFTPEPDSYDVIWIQWVIGEGPASLPCPPVRLLPLGFPIRCQDQGFALLQQATSPISTWPSSCGAARAASAPTVSSSSKTTWPRRA
ncbi:N-terminal Xaa-Pro-Lys N-methyltransferase 1 isoform X2 [Piliocolobus tephrosceles]|uniref:N-terminal Xaa-Pro-Lys N-methyltransferase 1 isoform X2 n=1 Tax=Piliocolobus tephrosceles TaxID=591936 RepID=UPI000E6B21B5|nr:N-terminal Xaa-Pro-Lys N-methyltransferase 1 isoform X2 [Piliocolobus tephrosceles]